MIRPYLLSLLNRGLAEAKNNLIYSRQLDGVIVLKVEIDLKFSALFQGMFLDLSPAHLTVNFFAWKLFNNGGEQNGKSKGRRGKWESNQAVL